LAAGGGGGGGADGGAAWAQAASASPPLAIGLTLAEFRIATTDAQGVELGELRYAQGVELFVDQDAAAAAAAAAGGGSLHKALTVRDLVRACACACTPRACV
jgi:hypothetical protein